MLIAVLAAISIFALGSSKHRSLAIMFVLVCLFSLRDGSEVEPETLAVGRYTANIAAIIALVFQISPRMIFSKPSSLFGQIVGIYVILILTNTVLSLLIHSDPFSLYQGFKDAFLLLSLFFAVSSSPSIVPREINLFVFAPLGFILAELARIFYYDGQGMISSSIIAFSMIPFCISVSKRRISPIFSCFLLVLGLVAIAFSGTRALLLSGVVLISFELARVIFLSAKKLFFKFNPFLSKKAIQIIALVGAFIGFFYYLVAYRGLGLGFKAIDFITIVNTNADLPLFQILEVLDPVRAQEYGMFFHSHPYQLLFGHGLGSGYYDKAGLFDFVSSKQFAFSSQELTTKIFYNFHDFLIDTGYRIGLLGVALIYGAIFQRFFSFNKVIFYCSIFLIANATYSVSGIMATSLFVVFAMNLSQKNESQNF
jgi:hypothetical protein